MSKLLLVCLRAMSAELKAQCQFDRAQVIDVTAAEIERLQTECGNDLKGRLDALSDDQRLELFGRYCAHCGCKQPESGMRCQCWNDE